MTDLGEALILLGDDSNATAFQLTGVVTALPSDGKVTVNSTGTPESVDVGQALAGQILVGDQVLMQRKSGAKWVTSILQSKSQQPDVGTVTSVGSGYAVLSTSAGAKQFPLPGGVAVAVGNTVIVAWGPSGGYIVGTRSQPLASRDPQVSYDPVIPPPPPPPTQVITGTSSFVAVQSGSFQGGSWRSDRVSQYYWPSYPVESWGAWFFGAAPTSTLSGATIDTTQILVHRIGGGVSGPQNIHLYLHTSRGQPAGDVVRAAGPSDFALNNDQKAWITIPAGWGQYIVDSGGGIGVAGSPYIVAASLDSEADSGQLSMTWHR